MVECRNDPIYLRGSSFCIRDRLSLGLVVGVVPLVATTLSTSIMILALRAYADGVDELAHYARWVDSTMGRNLTVKDALKHGPG